MALEPPGLQIGPAEARVLGKATLSQSFCSMARGLYLYPAASGESFRKVILYVLENKSSGQSAREGFFKEGRAQCALLCDSKNV